MIQVPGMQPPESLFTPTTTAAPSSQIAAGQLITFAYTSWRHDPYPLVVVTDIRPNERVRGINLHYLTFPTIKTLIQEKGNNPNFSYNNIKGRKFLTDSFRTYKWHGMQSIKKLDLDFVLKVLRIARINDPHDIRAIRESIQQQIRSRTDPARQAETMATQPLQNPQPSAVAPSSLLPNSPNEAGLQQ